MAREMDLLIREARTDDAGAILGIRNPIIEAGVYTALDTPLRVEAQRQFVRAFPPRGIFHLAVRREDGNVVGFQTMEPFADFTGAFDHVGIIATYVDLAHRRQGIGRRLFAATFPAAKQRGYEKILTYVRADNPAALACYLHQGFHIVGTARRQAKLNGKYVDEVFIERFL